MTSDEMNRDLAEECVQGLLRYLGEDIYREGLVETPKRFVKALDEWFSGYSQDPKEMLSKTFSEVQGYDEIVVLRAIRFVSHCEHHIAPIIGRATIAYLPSNRVVGISKLARLVDCYAKRLQIQERMTAQIADTLVECLQPRGVAVIISAEHHCMTTRGINKSHSDMVTSDMRGSFRDSEAQRSEVLALHLKE